TTDNVRVTDELGALLGGLFFRGPNEFGELWTSDEDLFEELPIMLDECLKDRDTQVFGCDPRRQRIGDLDDVTFIRGRFGVHQRSEWRCLVGDVPLTRPQAHREYTQHQADRARDFAGGLWPWGRDWHMTAR